MKPRTFTATASGEWPTGTYWSEGETRTVTASGPPPAYLVEIKPAAPKPAKE